MRIVPNPAVVPATARQFSIAIDLLNVADAGQLLSEVALPGELARAVPMRKLHFRAGRFCALQALRGLDPRSAAASLPRTARGVPAWPAGRTGSITHTDGFVSAAVARSSDVTAIGIDTERVMTAARASQVAAVVASSSELTDVRRAGCDRLEALTLVFSAKETVFKCLYGTVERFFDFHDVRIAEADARAGTFIARVVNALSSAFPAGTTFEGRFEIDSPWVHTGMVLSANPSS
jgi:enterobactin synthetase component D